jgi:hypothetical protein
LFCAENEIVCMHVKCFLIPFLFIYILRFVNEKKNEAKNNENGIKMKIYKKKAVCFSIKIMKIEQTRKITKK